MPAALAARLFEREGAKRVVIDPQLENERAIRGCEKAGFRERVLLRNHALHEGEPRCRWGMVREPVIGAGSRTRGSA
jgi:aminoglycoside 6'-N-acetyltransferase